MAIRNNHWYNLNEQHYYPLDDTASAISDAGDLLPSSMIADLRLRWPIDYGRYAFISAAALTPNLVTVLIEATDDLDNNPTSSVLIAGVTLPRVDLIAGRTYAMTAFKQGVGGFIVLGSVLDQLFSGRFSTPRQSLLTPRAARASRRPPVTSIGLENAATALTGLVNLVAIPPLQITKETRVIDEVSYDNVLVFRLAQEIDDIIQVNNIESVFSQFAGPCGRRVGSKTCPDPQPVETVNGVEADCDGIFTIDFRGCAVVGRNVEDCAIIVDCALGLTESCTPPYLPNLMTGELPIETPPILIPPPLPPEPPINPDVILDDELVILLALPYCDTFDDFTVMDGEVVPHGFVPVANSLFGFVSDDSPAEQFCCLGPPVAEITHAYGCQDVSISVDGDLVQAPEVASSYATSPPNAQARTNISLFTLDAQSLFRTFSTDVKIVQGQSGSEKNAGLLINYRLNATGSANYLVALLNLDTSTFGVYFFNGLNLVSLAHVVVSDVQVNHWYRIQFSAVPASTTSVGLTARLEGVTDPAISVTINTSLSANLWTEDAANSGFYARRSKSYYSYWRIDEVTP